jgi:proteasome activator subunit 4
MDSLLTHFASLADAPSAPPGLTMDDDASGAASPAIDDVDADEGALDSQLAALRTYLAALPYPCETPEQMHAALEHIVGRIYVCAEAKNWLVQGTWDGLLQW